MGSELTLTDVCKLIKEVNSNILTKIDEVKLDISNLNAKVDEQKNDLQRRLEELEAENTELRNRVARSEKQLKKNNLVIYGIEENDSEDREDVYEAVIVLVNDTLHVNLDSRDVSNCYRLGIKKGKARPVLVEFVQYKQKFQILRNRNKLKGSKIYINEDLTIEERSERKFLLEKLKEAKSTHKKAHIKGNKLIVEGTAYTLTDLKANESDINECYVLPSPRRVFSEPSTPTPIQFTPEQEINLREENREGKQSKRDKKQEFIETNEDDTIQQIKGIQKQYEKENKKKAQETPSILLGAIPKRAPAYSTRSNK